MGKPQETRGEVEGEFELEPKDISNICHLVTQRVSRQNEASLINLAITAHYDDGDSVTHRNIEDFESYHPTTQCKPVGISIDFIYLIKFQGKSVPEKQEINVSIETDFEYGHQRVRHYFRSGIFSYRILHTERTWAADISGLLKGHASTVIKKRTAFVSFLAENNAELIKYLGLIVFVCVVLVWFNHTNALLDNTAAYFKSNSEYNLTKYWTKSITVFVLLITCTGAISSFFDYHVILRKKSTITLTESDKKNLKNSNRKNAFAWVIYSFGWILNIVFGVIATEYISKII